MLPNSSNLLPFNQQGSLSPPQYEHIQQDDPSHYSTNNGPGDSYELGHFRSHSSGSHLLAESLRSESREERPISIASTSKSFARFGSGLWENSMLVDRSLRSMAVLTSFFGFLIMVLVFVCLKAFIHRTNLTSTSVFANAEKCRAASYKIAVCYWLEGETAINADQPLGSPFADQYRRNNDSWDVEYLSTTHHGS
jgi:hypothetical protein